MLVLSLKSPAAVKLNGVPGRRLPEPPPVPPSAPPPSICGGGNGEGGCAVADWSAPPMGCEDGIERGFVESSIVIKQVLISLALI